MDVRIGIAQSVQIIEVEMADDTDREALKAQISSVLASDGGEVLWLNDKRGKETAIPAERISFVELGTETASGRIGFGV